MTKEAAVQCMHATEERWPDWVEMVEELGAGPSPT